MGIGRVISLFSSSAVGVKLSCLFYRYFSVKSSVLVGMVRFYIIEGYFSILGFYLLGRFGFPDIRSLPAVNGEEDEGGRLCSPMWDLAEREKYFIVLYGTSRQ